MIGSFPNPYEDELIYSIFARYTNRSANLSVRDTLGMFFNDHRSKLTPDFPSNLNEAVKKLSIFEYESFEYLLYNHTPINYFTNFLMTVDKNSIIKEVRQKKSQNLQMSIGQVASTIKESKYFKYCPVCLNNDLLSLGESYWRLSHQLPSVMICTDHNEILHYSSVLYRNNNSQLVCPHLNNCNPSPLSQCVNDEIFEVSYENLFKLAIMSKELLNKEINIKPLLLVDKYKASLRIKGLITASGRVRQSELYEQFVSYYGIELLESLQSVPRMEKESCWLKTITRKHRISFHPVRHLLLMKFLEIELNEVEIIEDNCPFGIGPFPCLNPAAEHYKKLVVNDLQIKRCTDTGNPLGIFNCNCGFKYTRLGPDYLQEEMYNYRFIRNYGEVWVDKLREYIDKEHMSYRKAARLLQVDTGTAIKYYNKKQTYEEKKESLLKNIDYYRENWLSVRRENPNYSKTMLRKLNPKIYFWLYRNDREWLDSNSPTHINRVKFKTRVDWKKRDLKLVEDIKTYLQTINKNEKPKRITRRSIAVSIGKLSLIETHLDKLPSTKQLLGTVIESRFEYLERLNNWKKKIN